jgi:hypothetical protein
MFKEIDVETTNNMYFLINYLVIVSKFALNIIIWGTFIVGVHKRNVLP